MWVERSVHKLLQKHSIKACCCVTVSAEFKCGLKEESLVSVHVRFLNSHVLVKVKCLPGSQARDKRKFMCKSAPEGAVQFCVQALVQYVRNLHQNTAFRLKSFLFTGFILLCTADWTYWGNTEGPHFVVLCFFLCSFFCSRRKYSSCYSFTTLSRHILDQPFRKCLLDDTAITTVKNTEGWMAATDLSVAALKCFSFKTVLCCSSNFFYFFFLILCILVAMNGPCIYCDALS